MNPAVLKRILDGPEWELKDKVRQLLSDGQFVPGTEELGNLQIYRASTTKWAKQILAAGLLKFEDVLEKPAKFVAWFSALGMGDASTAIKLVVQISLFGQTLLRLGTERHRKLWKETGSGDLPGVFAMTELNHGTNVDGLETTATWDGGRCGFVVHTPHWAAQKYWPGNIACDGEMAAVFCRLIMPSGDKGVHVVLVPLRDRRTKALLPGIHVRDIGVKEGLNGIDNGGLWFDHVFVPREALLNRFADVSPDGTYTCQFDSASHHFGATVGALAPGRGVIVGLGVSALKVGVSIAVKYAHVRRQFHAPGKTEETLLIDYQSHKMRLMPWLATCLVFDALMQRIEETTQSKLSAEYHSQISALKSVVTWETLEGLQVAREACGGQGYIAVNRICVLRNDVDMYTTGEGDNTVLTLQLAKFMLKELAKVRDGKRWVELRGKSDWAGPLSFLNKRKPSAMYGTDAVLRSRDWQNQVFGARMAEVFDEMVTEVEGAMSLGKSQWEALNQATASVQRLTWANADYILWRLMQRLMARAAPGSAERRVLDIAANLRAMKSLHRDSGFLSSREILTGQQVRHVEQLMGRLCSDLAKVSLDVVDAFGIPEQWLGKMLE